MFKLIFLALISLSLAQAESLETILGSAMSPVPEECRTETSFQACARDLCGHPVPENSLQIVNDDFYARRTDVVKDKDKKLKEMEEKMRAYLKSHNENVIKIKAFIEKGAQKVNLDKWGETELQEAEYDIFRQYIYPRVDHTKPLNERVTMILNPPSSMSLDERMILKAYADRLKASYFENPLRLISQEIYTEKEVLKEIKTLWKEVSQYPLNPNLKQYWEDEISSIETSETSLYGVYDKLRKVSQRYKDETPRPGSNLFCKDSECRKLMQKYLENKSSESLKPLAHLFVKYEASEKEILDMAKTCLANNIVREEMNHKAREFQKRLPDVTERFISKGMANFSEHSKKTFRDYLNTKVQYNIEHEKPSDLGDRFRRITDGENAARILGAKSILSNPFYFMEECSVPYKKKDQVQNSEEKSVLELSYFTCSHEELGNQIVAHEIGHILSFVVTQGLLSPESRKQFLESRDCVSSRHKTSFAAPMYSFSHGGDHKHSEEDHADYFSSLTYPEGPLKLCALVTQNYDRTSYVVTDRVSNVAHSNELLRVLWEASQKMKKIPKSCEDTFKDHPDFDLKSCRE